MKDRAAAAGAVRRSVNYPEGESRTCVGAGDGVSGTRWMQQMAIRFEPKRPTEFLPSAVGRVCAGR